MKLNKINIKDDEYKKLIEPYKKEALVVLKEFVTINSVLDKSSATIDMPFGKGVNKALEFIATIGKKIGFNVDRCDNYVTELSYGEGKILDIYAHVDVVPVVEKNWIHEPFKVTIEDDIMYGRGVADDKGPGIACLYACKALIDNKMLNGFKLRFLFGGNEESGSLCLEHYFKEMKKEYPTFGFSPDSDYPLIYAEKTISSYIANYNIDLKTDNFSFGDALNIVLGEVNLNLKDNKLKDVIVSYTKKHSEVKIKYENDNLSIIGVPAHGSMPYNGVNAGLHLLNILGELLDNKELKNIYDYYLDGRGNKFNGNYKDDNFDGSTYNVGKIVYDKNKKLLQLYVNFRFPSTLNAETLIKEVATNTNCDIKILGYSEGFAADLNNPYIKSLLSSYQEETGDLDTKPLAIGGGTYARESKNSVAFGACFPTRDYNMHGNDEFFPIDDFYANMQIYAKAIYELGKLLSK